MVIKVSSVVVGFGFFLNSQQMTYLIFKNKPNLLGLCYCVNRTELHEVAACISERRSFTVKTPVDTSNTQNYYKTTQ